MMSARPVRPSGNMLITYLDDSSPDIEDAAEEHAITKLAALAEY